MATYKLKDARIDEATILVESIRDGQHARAQSGVDGQEEHRGETNQIGIIVAFVGSIEQNLELIFLCVVVASSVQIVHILADVIVHRQMCVVDHLVS